MSEIAKVWFELIDLIMWGVCRIRLSLAQGLPGSASGLLGAHVRCRRGWCGVHLALVSGCGGVQLELAVGLGWGPLAHWFVRNSASVSSVLWFWVDGVTAY